MSESFEDWIDTQYRASACHLRRCVSPVDVVKHRPGFGQTVRAARGCIVASPVLADWDPEPDYFFHWFRDSALVVDALRVLYEDAGPDAQEILAQVQDFVRFSCALLELDGRQAVLPRNATAPEFQQYLRESAELSAVHGEAVMAETRVNADGTLDFTRWSRPQHDGVALRALALLRWLRVAVLDAGAARLLRADLAFTRRRAQTPAYDIWEEELGWHWYTLRVSAAALDAGAAWLEAQGEHGEALAARKEGEALRARLRAYWLEDAQQLASRVLASGEPSSKQLDSSVILAAIHARDTADPRLSATLDRLDAHFAARYALNQGRAQGFALGRYPGDVYHGGHPWYLCTLAAAEFCYRVARGERAWMQRGDAYLATVRAFTPSDGALSEQFDARSGAQGSARHLAWSYAAFISCVAARREACAA